MAGHPKRMRQNLPALLRGRPSERGDQGLVDGMFLLGQREANGSQGVGHRDAQQRAYRVDWFMGGIAKRPALQALYVTRAEAEHSLHLALA